MAELTADQQAQAGKLNGTMPWVYPDTSDAAFWNNYFNPQPTLTADEQASGISIGPADSSYYTRPLRQTSTPTPQVLPGVTQSSAPTSYTFQPTSGTVTQPRMLVGSNPTAAPVGESGTGNWSYGGDGDYQSSLIKSLRESSPAAPYAPGVMLRANDRNSAPIDLTELNYGSNLNAPSGLSMNVQPIGSGRTNPNFSYSTDAINQALIDEVRARPGSTYEELLAAAEGYGVTPDEFNTAFANMGFTDMGLTDVNQDKVIDAQDLSTQDISRSLEAELAARPDSSFEDLRDFATTVYDIPVEDFNAGWADMGFTDMGLTDVNQDNVVNAGDLSTQDIANALMAELSARPGSSYEDLLNMATSVYGISPEQFSSGYGLYQNPPGAQP